MKIIFSRKGFDSTAGGFPSIIFPDGTLFSVPIPSSNDRFLYRELDFHYENDSIQKILNDLTNKNICANVWRECDYVEGDQFCHYDPMPFDELDFKGIALGQVKQAESHLRNQGIDKGDIFLFYGWFKKVEKRDGIWRYVQEAPDIHMIWSYMTVGELVCLDTNEQQDLALEKYPFLNKHPHIGEQGKMKNRIYLSNDYGYFKCDEECVLTDTTHYRGRATWRLPICFNQPRAFTYLKNFKVEDGEVVISYQGYGQEFVLNLDKVESSCDRRDIQKYIESLISKHAHLP